MFDTLYAEGQRRYVETFSAYARQFLDRMDRPQVERVDGVPPAIAIDQTNPVRSSRSTVGTMTELNDHLKLLYARAAELFDQQTAQPVRHDSPETIYAELLARTAEGQPHHDARLVVTFPVELPESTTEEEVQQWLSVSGYTRVQAQRVVASSTGARKMLDVVADRFRIGSVEKRARWRPSKPRCAAAAAASMSMCLPMKAKLRSGASPPACTAPTATCAMPIRSRRYSRSTLPTAPAKPAAGLAV